MTDPNDQLVIDNTYETVNIPAGSCTSGGSNSPALNNYETGRVQSQSLARLTQESTGQGEVNYTRGAAREAGRQQYPQDRPLKPAAGRMC